MDFNMAGPAIALGLSLIGSSIGCYISGAASHAAMSRTEEGHGKFIGNAKLHPLLKASTAFSEMLLMSKAIQAGTLSPLSAIFIGVFAGGAIMISSIYQGKVCATGIQASLKDPSIFGKCFAAVGIIESVSLFAFVFSLLIM